MVRRRGFLAGLATGLGAVAGCSAPAGDSPEPTTTTGESDPAADGTTREQSGTGTTAEQSSDATTTTAGAGRESWPMFGFDAANTGFGEGVSGPEADAGKLWQRNIPGVNGPKPPSVADGGVFVANQMNLVRIDAAGGGLDWRTDTGTFNTVHTPAVADGTVYVAGRDREIGRALGLVTRDPTAPGKLTAVDAESGEIQWALDTQISSTPTVLDGHVVYLALDPDRTLSVRSVDPAGERNWRGVVDVDGTVDKVAPPACDGERIFATARLSDAGGNRGAIAAVGVDGTQQWTVRTESEITAAPAVAGGLVYVVTRDGTVHAFDAADGTEQWTASPGLERSVRVPPAVAYGSVFVGGRAGAAALDAADGTEQWRTGTSTIALTTISVADDIVYYGGISLKAVAAGDGTRLWSFANEGFESAYPGMAVADGAVYATTCIKQKPADPYQHAVVGVGET